MSKKKILSLAIMLIAAAMIVLGVFREEAVDVFNKAILICLECIGIG
jgi:uncharacterized protein YoxC